MTIHRKEENVYGSVVLAPATGKRLIGMVVAALPWVLRPQGEGPIKVRGDAL
jgi:hypothetical protein